MRGGVQQDLVLVLSVQIDKAAAKLPQRRTRRERAVHGSAAPTLRRDFAADDDLLAGWRLEDGFDRGRLFAGADQVRGRSSTHQEANRSDEDGFAGASFASQDVQARLEFELEPIDDGEMSDREESQHGSIVIVSSAKEAHGP